ncbi:putative acetyl-coenzyme A transporter [Gregarina niphandrodes]|uniref:Acetyl-coenzyme A transporter n=1 Tax=Gregarina niphandrodes TaxID=110365 RepID=A0A023B7A4_GRENI|nr:putative acetyl-coenzyme A transporter [Gregarina niphandrodes]EZG67150.1 putative acetyl-coenzyme A transporter [Gregarina niphandrodes]|eukprot:XP_011130319.1 putative acetyl-coenzyme A transporter [Gregarina niphandrodes]
MMRLHSVQLMCLVLMTCRLPFGPVDGAATLKIIETGSAKEVLALLAPIAFPIGITTSVLTGRGINKRFSALGAFKAGFLGRVLLGFVWLLIYKFAKTVGGDQPGIYTIIILGVCCQAICSEIMFVSQMAFFAQVSDVSMGGTYMTFFNTVANLGNKWPSMLMLSLMDQGPFIFSGWETFVELTTICSIGGVAWMAAGGRLLDRLEQMNPSDWELSSPSSRVVTEDSMELINQVKKRRP